MKCFGLAILILTSVLSFSHAESADPIDQIEAFKAFPKHTTEIYHRITTIVKYEIAYGARVEAYDAWRDFKAQGATAPDFEDRVAQLRDRYFETRANYDRVLEQLKKFYE